MILFAILCVVGWWIVESSRACSGSGLSFRYKSNASAHGSSLWTLSFKWSANENNAVRSSG